MVETIRAKALEAHRANLERLLTLCHSTIASTERLASLHLSTARALMEDVNTSMSQQLSQTDAAQRITAPAEMVQPIMEKAVAYSRELFEIMNQAQESLNQICAAQQAEGHVHIEAALAGARKLAPAGTEAAIAGLQSAAVVARRTQAGLAEAARKVAELGKANIARSLASVEKATRTPTLPQDPES